jgi:ParB family chromosome partitioning protein
LNEPNKRGLPSDIKMRHERHYVEDLFSDITASSDFRFVETKTIFLNEDQPRKDIGDLNGLALSIKEKGVLEPILLRRVGDKYSIISGERRFRAASIAGLSSVPAIILNVNDLGSLEIALIENLQRKDLTPFEESDAYSILVDRFNLTHDEIAGKIGKSRINITESITLSRIPESIRNFCKEHNINSKSVLIEIARIQDYDEMRRFAEEIVSGGLSRAEIRNKKRNEAENTRKAVPYVFKYRPDNKSFKLNLIFKKTQVEKSEIIQALMKIIEDLKQE